MRSQSPIVTKTPSLANNNTKEPSRSTTPIIIAPTKPHSTLKQKPKSFQMTTGNSFGASNNNDAAQSHSPQETQQNPLTCKTIPSTSTSSSANILVKSSSTSIRNLSTNNNNSSASVNKNSKLSNESNNNNKLQTLEQRKLELEKLLNEKNWLLQQIHKQEAQILNGNYENFNVFELGKLIGNSTGSATFNNSVLRRKGSSSLKLSKNNGNLNGKSNRFTLSKSEYDLAQQEINNKGSPVVGGGSLMGIKKQLQGPPQKTNSFHDSSSAAVSALSLTKSPSFEFNENGMKYSAVRPSQHYSNSSNENLSNNFGITQCDKYYLSPTSQMYTDGNGFIKASQNIKQCLSSPSPIHKISSLDSTEMQTTPLLEHYDALSLSPSNNTCDQQQNAHFWRAMSNNWSNDSYIELDNEQFQNIKSTSKKIISPGSSSVQQQHSPLESATLQSSYPGGTGAVLRNSYPPNINEKSCDELSISSVNSELSKKPKNKQWMESSLDGPIIRPNILQTTPMAATTDGIAAHFPSMSPTAHSPLSKHYAYYNVARQAAETLTLSPSAVGFAVPSSINCSRPPTRTLIHYAAHPQPPSSSSKQGFHRERTKLSSQSMSSGSYRKPKTKFGEEASQFSHSTSFLNYDPYHHDFQQQQQPQKLSPQLQQHQQQVYNQNHYHMELSLQHQKQIQLSHLSLQPIHQKLSQSAAPTSSSLCHLNDDHPTTRQYATQPPSSRLCNPTKNPDPLSINTLTTHVSPSAAASATSPDILIESPKNMTVVQQATFLPYKEITKPFEMSDFYKYSIKFRQKDANSLTMSKNQA